MPKTKTIQSLIDEALKTRGKYGAARVERAADEIKNLEKLYDPSALRQAFLSQSGVASIPPQDFAKFAYGLEPTEGRKRYVDYLKTLKPFFDVPYLNIEKTRKGPRISEHEGRHRSLALESEKQPASLIRVYPEGSLVPGNRIMMTQEEMIEAMRRELGEDRMVIPQDDTFPEQFPDIYKDGGSVKMGRGGKILRDVTQMAVELKGKGKAFKAPQDVALSRAQKRATEILGLPPDNTPEQRAAALGYVDYLHGTQRLDRLLEKKSINPKRATSGPMPFGTDKPELASSYATNKPDTSRIAQDVGELEHYFQVDPKSLGISGRSPISVERSWHFLPAEKKQEIMEKARRIGYENPEEATGPFVVHPSEGGAPFPASHYDYILSREARGNPLTALRRLYAESGTLDPYQPSELAEIYRLAGYPHEISQVNAPWTEAQGVLLGKARITNPLMTNDYDAINERIIPFLKDRFAKDRSRTKPGADPWAKESRFTPKEWVDQLEQDTAKGTNSYVWTSIPDKVTEALKEVGYNGIIDTSGKGGGLESKVVIPFYPSQVRSRFAAFDPTETESPDLLKKDGGPVHLNGGGNPIDEAIKQAKMAGAAGRPIRQAAPVDIDQMRRELEQAAAETAALKARREREKIEAMPPAEMKPYDPTIRQRLAEAVTKGLRSVSPAPRARAISDILTGGVTGGVGVADVAPFVGAAMAGEEAARGAQEAIEQGNYGEAALQAGIGALSTLPGLPATARAAKPIVRHAGKMIDEAMITGQGPLAGGLSAIGPKFIVKPKGGNWLLGSVESALEPLNVTVREPGYLAQIRADGDAVDGLYDDVLSQNKNAELINNWIGKKLTKYFKNEMGTQEDPLRALAEQGILHYRPDIGAVRAKAHRQLADNPTDPIATSPLARAWEDVADAAILPGSYAEHTPLGGFSEDALRKLGGQYAVDNPQAIAYKAMQAFAPSDLGFRHLIDEMRNALNPESGLPRELLIEPKYLERMTVPQMVERVAKINEWRAAQKVEADKLRANNAATVLHKEYPEQGYKWVELRQPKETGKKITVEKFDFDLPHDISQREMREVAEDMAFDEGFDEGTQEFDDFVRNMMTDFNRKKKVEMDESIKALEDALKYEGDVMGHCVGGYCEDVAAGKTRIYSLRDAKGEPHVTIETRPAEMRGGQSADEWLATPHRIIQIKGKGNRAPKEEYLPFVQDFVRSGQWSDVGDLRNAGMFRVQPGQRWPGFSEEMPAGYYTFDDARRMAQEKGMDPEVLESWMKKLQSPYSYAKGGPVRVSQDAMNIAVMDKAQKKDGKKKGGKVERKAEGGITSDDLIIEERAL